MSLGEVVGLGIRSRGLERVETAIGGLREGGMSGRSYVCQS